MVLCGALVALCACSSSSPAGGGTGGNATGGDTARGGTVGQGTGGQVGAGGAGLSTGTGGTGGTASGHGGTTADGSASDGPVGGALNPVAAHGQLKVVGTQLQDQHGNPVQLKGVSSQWLNYESKTFPESKAAIQWARDNWKLSVIRAAMGVDASGGYLGTTATNANAAGMLTKVQTIVQNAIDLGIYVIIDWHTSTAVSTSGSQAAQASEFFTMMAQKYGTTPNVIYEDYNEPNKVTWAQIKPYHEAVVAAIRAVDPDNLIILGTPTYSQDVDVAAMDPVAGTNLMYTLHFYACTHKQSLRDKGTAALSMGLPLFITEFGATPADGGVVKSGDPYVCEDEANSWFAWMSQHNISGASWKLDQCTDTSCILKSSAPVDGPWTDDVLTSDTGGTAVATGGVQPPSGGGHGQFVVNWMRQ
ncbi:MAG: glycoside hydrolase family 5 protein [Verrucomicrobiota bacterium]